MQLSYICRPLVTAPLLQFAWRAAGLNQLDRQVSFSVGRFWHVALMSSSVCLDDRVNIALWRGSVVCALRFAFEWQRALIDVAL